MQNFNKYGYLNYNGLNPYAYQCMLNMFLGMNPNLNVNNQMNLNNMMIQYMNNQQNCNPLGIVNPGLNNNAIINGGIMRNIKTNPGMSNERSAPDLFPGNFENRINVQFITGPGHKLTIATPYSTKLSDLFVKYINQVGVDPKFLGTKIYFIINAENIPCNSNKTILEYASKYGSLNNILKVLVLDASNLIGA